VIMSAFVPSRKSQPFARMSYPPAVRPEGKLNRVLALAVDVRPACPSFEARRSDTPKQVGERECSSGQPTSR
jgi:hypothetical protein